MHPCQTIRFYFSILWGRKLEICPQTNKSKLHSEKVVSKTKTPKTKTEDPLEDKDPLGNEHLENEDPLEKEIMLLLFYKGVRRTRDQPIPGSFPVHHCVVNMITYSMTSENKKVTDAMNEK